jgi:hypothetical protein
MDADSCGTPENGGCEPVWGRQHGESDKAFEAFAIYRDLGPTRSTQEVAIAVAKSAPFIRRWSAKWSWVARASAWDDEADRLRRERDLVERQESRRKMLDTHARGGAALHEIGSNVLDRFDLSNPETAEVARERIEKLSLVEAARLTEAGAKMERLARGDASGRVTDAQALKFVERLVDLTLAHLPPDRHEPFLTEVEAFLGTGNGF